MLRMNDGCGVWGYFRGYIVVRTEFKVLDFVEIVKDEGCIFNVNINKLYHKFGHLKRSYVGNLRDNGIFLQKYGFGIMLGLLCRHNLVKYD